MRAGGGSDAAVRRPDWGALWAPLLARVLRASGRAADEVASMEACEGVCAVRVLCRAARDAVDAEREGVVVPLPSPCGVRSWASVAEMAEAIVGNAKAYVETARAAAGLLERACVGRGARRIVLDNKAAQFANGVRDGLLRALAHELSRGPAAAAAAGRVTSLVLIGLDPDDEPTDAALAALLCALPNIETLHVHESHARGLTGACLGELAAMGAGRGRPLARLLCTGPMHSGMRGVPRGAVAEVVTQWKDLLAHYRRRGDAVTAVRAIPLDEYRGLLLGLRLHHACGYRH